MNFRVNVLCLGLVFVGEVAHGQTPKVDLKVEEAVLRALIQAPTNPTSAKESVRWTGAYKRPFMAPDKGELFAAEVIAMRKNQKRSTKIERIEVAASGDMAWDFSIVTLEFDLDGSSEHVKFDTGSLRTWKKEDGQWKVAATFMRPLDTPFAKP
jgi:hypothetical protein